MTNERAITIIDDVNAYLASRSIYENDSIAGYTYRVICQALTQLKQSALESQPMDKCKGCYYNDGEAHAECVLCDKEAQPTDEVKCNYTTEEIAKSFIEDVEVVKDQLDGQLCEDCISREQVEEITFQEPSYTDPYNILTEVREKVRALPAVYPERPKGKWIHKMQIMSNPYTQQCSVCKEWQKDKSKYCPNCGAKMEVNADDGDSN